MTQYDINIRDFWRIVRKRKMLIFGVTICLSLLSVFFSYMNMPLPVFESVASVKIQRSGTMTGIYMESLSWNPEDNISTQAEVIRSFPIMQKVAQELGYLDSNLAVNEILSDENAVSTIIGLTGYISTTQEGLTNIINIIATGDAPLETQTIANTVAKVYIEEITIERNQRATNALKFIEMQLDSISFKLRETEEEVMRYRERENVITLDIKTDLLTNRLGASEDDYFILQSKRTEIETLMKELKKGQRKSLKNIFITLDPHNQTDIFLNLSKDMVDLYVQKDQLLIDFTEKHPDVVEIDVKIKKVYNNLYRELQSQHSSLVRREKIKYNLIQKIKEEYQTLPKDGLELTRLQRKMELYEDMYTFLESKHQEALLKNAEKVKEASLVKPALRGYQVNPPSSTLNTAMLGGIIGLILGLLGAFIFESLDTSFETIEEVERTLDISVIGIIPQYDEQELIEKLRLEGKFKGSERALKLNARLSSFSSPKSTLAESYRALRTNVHYLTKVNQLNTIVVTSSTTGEGKTTTISNLAIAMSQIGLKTLLIDCDLRRPMVHKIFGLDKEPGLSDIMMDTIKWQDCIHTITDIMMGPLQLEDVLLTPGMDNLHILTSGLSVTTPSELMNSSEMPELLKEMKKTYDVILLDSTPVLSAADATILSSWVDGVILVYKVGRTARGALKRTKLQLENINVKIVGIVVNSFKVELNPDYKDFYGKYYSYGSEPNQKK